MEHSGNRGKTLIKCCNVKKKENSLNNFEMKPWTWKWRFVFSCMEQSVHKINESHHKVGEASAVKKFFRNTSSNGWEKTLAFIYFSTWVEKTNAYGPLLELRSMWALVWSKMPLCEERAFYDNIDLGKNGDAGAREKRRTRKGRRRKKTDRKWRRLIFGFINGGPRKSL